MNDTATQPGVEEKEVIVGNTARNELVASIAERARKERDEELRAEGIEPVNTLDEPKEEEEVPEHEDKQEEIKEEAKEEIKENVKLKVDGEEREVPKEKVIEAGIRALQKESTADKRLEEATRLLREAQERQEKIAQQEQQKQEPPPSQKWDDATVAYALEHGTEEQKAYAISQLREREQGPTPDQIAQYAEQRVLDRVDFVDASKWFVSEYSDIAKDPYLFQLAALEEDRLIAQGDTRSRKEIYKEIGDGLRTWKGGNSAQTLEQKKEQKSNIVNLPSASVKKSSPTEAKPKTTSDIIEDMRKARGQK